MVEANSKCPKCAQGPMKLIRSPEQLAPKLSSRIDTQPNAITTAVRMKSKLWSRISSSEIRKSPLLFELLVRYTSLGERRKPAKQIGE